MNENQKIAFIGLANAIQELGDQNLFYLPERMPRPYSKSMLKNLCEFGMINVWTVREIAWANYDGEIHRDSTSYKIVVTKKGWLYFAGLISDPQKYCNESEKYPWGLCKRHNVRHR